MAAAAITIGYAPGWDVEVYETLSVASRVALAVQRSARTLALAVPFWRLDRRLQMLLDDIYQNAGKAERGELSNTPPPTEEQIRDAVNALRAMHRVLDDLYRAAKIARLTNHSLLAASINSIHSRADEVLDLVEWIEMALDREAMAAIADLNAKARVELEREEVYDLSQVR